MIDETHDHAKQIEEAASALKNEKSLVDLKSQLKEKSELFDSLQKQLSEIDSKNGAQEEEMKLKVQNGLKELAIKDQKIEFLDIQLKETRDQLDEANKQHQSMVEAMNANQVELKNSGEEERLISESP